MIKHAHEQDHYQILINVHYNEAKILSLDEVAEDFIVPNGRKRFVFGVKDSTLALTRALK